MKNLPIKASLTTREGFHKCIDIDEIRPYLEVGFFESIQCAGTYDPNSLPLTPSALKKEFHLEKYREVKQNKGLHHIVAVYKEI